MSSYLLGIHTGNRPRGINRQAGAGIESHTPSPSSLPAGVSADGGVVESAAHRKEGVCNL